MDNQGRPTPSSSLVAAVQSVIGQVTNQTSTTDPGPLIPPPPALPPVIETPAMTPPAQAGQACGQSGMRRGDSSSVSSISNTRITVNDQVVNEAFDRSGNLL